jgi:hypothetical protein
MPPWFLITICCLCFLLAGFVAGSTLTVVVLARAERRSQDRWIAEQEVRERRQSGGSGKSRSRWDRRHSSGGDDS